MERLFSDLFGRKTAVPNTTYYTERARRVNSLSQQKAIEAGSSSIGGIHLMAGILQEGDCLGVRVLRNLLGERFDQFSQAVSEQLSGGTPETSQPASVVGLSEEAKEMLALTEREVRRLKHHYVGTEHQLLGILRYSEQRDTLPVFQQFGITHSAAVQETRRILTRAF